MGLGLGVLRDRASTGYGGAQSAVAAARQRALEALAGRADLTGDMGDAYPSASARLIARGDIGANRLAGLGAASGAWWVPQSGIAESEIAGYGAAGAAAFDEARKKKMRGGRRLGGGGAKAASNTISPAEYDRMLAYDIALRKLRRQEAAGQGIWRGVSETPYGGRYGSPTTGGWAKAY